MPNESGGRKPRNGENNTNNINCTKVPVQQTLSRHDRSGCCRAPAAANAEVVAGKGVRQHASGGPVQAGVRCRGDHVPPGAAAPRVGASHHAPRGTGPALGGVCDVGRLPLGSCWTRSGTPGVLSHPARRSADPRAEGPRRSNHGRGPRLR